MLAYDRANELHDAMEPHTARDVDRSRDRAVERQFLVRLVACMLLAAPMLAPLFGLPFRVQLHLNPWIACALATLIVVIGAPIYRGAWTALRALTVTTDLLTALCVTVAYAASAFFVLREGAAAGDSVFFENVAVIMTLALLARWLETRALPGTGEAVRQRADPLAAFVALAAVAVAVVAFLVWFGGGKGFDESLYVAASVLAIACPATLALAVPVALVAERHSAVRAGIRFRNAATIAQVARVDTVVFDKAGTLTEGQPAVVGIELAPGVEERRLLRMVAALQIASGHPFAAAFRAAAPVGVKLPAVERCRVEPGRGVLGVVEGREVAIGNRDLMRPGGIELGRLEAAVTRFEREAKTGFIVAADGRALGVIAVMDPLRPQSVTAVQRLAAQGVRAEMFCADAEPVARKLASDLALADCRVAATPEEKTAALQALERLGRRVGWVVTNADAATVAAPVVIALGGGRSSADVVLERADPRLLPAAIDVARRTVATIRRNLIGALAFNAIGIPFAAAGLMTSEIVSGAAALSLLWIAGATGWLACWRWKARR